MGRSTGPVLAVGVVTLTNQVVMHGKPMNWRIPIATGIAAMGLSVLEKPLGKGAEMLAWLALFAVLFGRTDPQVPSPVETLNDWWHGK